MTNDEGRPLRFDLKDAQVAADEWGFNCGPAALCAVLGQTPAEIRPHLLGFETKGYTNPKLMADILRGLQAPFRRVFEQTGNVHAAGHQRPRYPRNGLVRIQWDGRWCNPGVPPRVAYRHTHWIAYRSNWRDGVRLVFDINAICVGWIPWSEWEDELVPWLLKQAEPEATGGWWPTHCWEIDRTGSGQ